MTHVRDEVATHLFEAPAFGDVARDDHRVTRVGCDGRHFQNEVRAFGLRDEGSRVVARLHPLTKPLVVQHVEKGLADHVGRKAQVAQRHVVQPLDLVVVAQNHDALGQECQRLTVAEVAVANAAGFPFVFVDELAPHEDREQKKHRRSRSPKKERGVETSR